jgi:preprotein translocase subunit SecY
LSACIILQVAGIFIPPLKRICFDSESGRRRLVQITAILALLIAFVQGLNLSNILYKDLSLWQGLLIENKIVFICVSALSFAAALFILIWLAQVINRWGIGNGIPILITSSIVAEIVNNLRLANASYDGNFFCQFMLIYIYIAAVILILFYNFVSELQRKVYINFKNKNETVKTNTFLPMRNSWVGRMPLTITIATIWLPFRYLTYYNNEFIYNIAIKLSSSNVVYISTLFVLVLIFTYLYSLIIYKPGYIVQKLKKYKAVLEDIKESDTLKFLKRCGYVYGLGAGLFLFFIAALPALAQTFLEKQPCEIAEGTNYIMTTLTSVGLLIIVGVVIDIKRQIIAHRQMQKSDVKDWSLCYTTIDEIEANIKKGFLESKGIPAVVKPYQFTWGMPIRTAIDKFEVYVRTLDADLARDFLTNM